MSSRDQIFTVKKGHISNPRTRVLNYKASLDKVEQETPRIHVVSEKRRTGPTDKESRLRGTLYSGQATQILSIKNLSRHRGWNYSGEHKLT